MSQGGIIRLGDKTTGGGTVISCQFASFYRSENKAVAVVGDKASCPKHKGVFAFVEGEPTVTCMGRATVLQGHKLACGCYAISSITAAHYVDKPAPTFAPVPAPAPTALTQADGPASALDVAAPASITPLAGVSDLADATPPKVLVTLRIGMFFDGTANNVSNARIGAQCRAMARDKHEEAVLLAGCQYVNDTSYGDGPTNVRHLFTLYPDNTLDDAPITHGGDYFIPLYIEGDGTVSGESDSTLGLSTGEGDTGMEQRVEGAFYVSLKFALDQFAKKHPRAYVQAIELDIFGFSRGAAEARHCLHLVNQRGHGPLGDVLPDANLKLKPGFAWKTDLRAGFVGLFDTVSHLGVMPGTSVASNAVVGFYLCLPAGCATRGVVHLTARDECRVNFPLTSAAPPYKDIPLPGVHSDIGGGYLDNAVETVWLIRPIIGSENAKHPLESSRACREAARQLKRLQANDSINASSMSVHCWAVPDELTPESRFGVPMQTVAATVQMQRTLSNAYAGIPLRVMRMLATKAGVPFNAIDENDPANAMPSELMPVLASVMSYAQMDSSPYLTPEAEQMLRQRYLHHSADWHVTGPTWLPSMALLYINRPTDDGKRVVIPNEDPA